MSIQKVLQERQRKNKRTVTNVTIHPQIQDIWGNIWKCTVAKSQTNATSVIMHPLIQVHWGHIWRDTVEKSQTNATNATMHPLTQAIWGDIWRRTVEKSQTSATSVTFKHCHRWKVTSYHFFQYSNFFGFHQNLGLHGLRLLDSCGDWLRPLHPKGAQAARYRLKCAWGKSCFRTCEQIAYSLFLMLRLDITFITTR